MLTYQEEMRQLAERRISSRSILKGKILHMMEDQVLTPGGKLANREIVRHMGAVCVIPVDNDGNAVMERQYRYAIDEVITEVPAGKLDYASEDHLDAARRELREETGYTADTWIDLGSFYPAPAYSDEKIQMYLAQDLHKGDRELDEDENINVELIPLQELVSDVMKGRISDSKTQLAIMKAAYYLSH